MPLVIDGKQVEPPPLFLEALIPLLDRGGRVGLPTGGSYVVAARARERLESLPDLTDTPRLHGRGDLSDCPADWTDFERRLARRLWPGLVILERADGTAWLVPPLLATRRLLGQVGGLWLAEVAPGGQLPFDPAAMLALLDGADDALLDAGPAAAPDIASIVQIQQRAVRLLRQGVLDATGLQRQLACWIGFVCTGNTCRSPMAEVIFKRLLAERLGCSVGDLAARGFVVFSAGVAADPGSPASEGAQAAVRNFGADLSQHTSQAVEPDVIAQADYLIAMTNSHRRLLMQRVPDAVPPRLLRGDDGDLPDPFGGDDLVYQDCARLIENHLHGLVEEVCRS